MDTSSRKGALQFDIVGQIAMVILGFATGGILLCLVFAGAWQLISNYYHTDGYGTTVTRKKYWKWAFLVLGVLAFGGICILISSKAEINFLAIPIFIAFVFSFFGGIIMNFVYLGITISDLAALGNEEVKEERGYYE